MIKFYLMFKSVAEWAKAHKTEVWIFVLAFGVRFLYAILVQVFFGAHGFIAHSDTFSFYLRGAENLLEHGVLSLNTEPPYLPDAYRTPLYTLFVTFFLWLKFPLFAVIFSQNIMAGFISVFVYRVGLILFSHQVALWAAILAALEPLSIYWNNLLMSDYLFAFFFVLSVYAFFLRRYYFFAIFLGLATLTRPISLYFLPLFIAVAAAEKIRIGQKLNLAWWRVFLVASILFLLVLFPWMLRNKIVFDTWGLSSASWYNLYMVLMQKFAYKEGFTLPQPPPGPGVYYYHFDNMRFYQSNYFSIVAERPLSYAVFHLSLALKSRLMNYYQHFADYVLKPELPRLFNGKGALFIAGAASILTLAWIIMYVLMLLSFFEQKNRAWLALFLCIIAINMATQGTTWAYGLDGSRFNMAFGPFIFLFAGEGFRLIISRIRNAKN